MGPEYSSQQILCSNVRMSARVSSFFQMGPNPSGAHQTR